MPTVIAASTVRRDGRTPATIADAATYEAVNTMTAPPALTATAGALPSCEATIASAAGPSPSARRCPEVGAVEAKGVGHELADHSLGRRNGRVVRLPLHSGERYPPVECAAVGRGSRPSVRWKADRQRKKKARGAKKAADAGTARKTKR